MKGGEPVRVKSIVVPISDLQLSSIGVKPVDWRVGICGEETVHYFDSNTESGLRRKRAKREERKINLLQRAIKQSLCKIPH